VLNSPIGDLRNKLFSDPTSPFYAPGHLLAGDTITFNHGHMCGFGGCYHNTISRNARSGFGMFSSRPTDVLDGRSVWHLSDRDYWVIFRSYDFPNRSGQFNRYVTPEGWRYSNRPWATGPGPDTLFLDSCIGWEFNTMGLDGCVDTWSDTLPGGINNSYGNVSAGIGVGPFPLAAGDTTKYTLAIVTGEGRAEIEVNIQSAIDYYLDSYPPVEVAVIEELQDDIDDLVAGADLNQGQGGALTTKLDVALEKMAAGQDKVAMNLLNAFVNQVLDFIATGVLSQEQGEALITRAEFVIEQLTP
jgi:hypothetical protein